MRIFVDIDTQKDFMESPGALYVPQADKIISTVRKLTEVAVKYRIPILASMDEHTGLEADKEKEMELSRWGGPFPDHCMKGMHGARLVNEDLMRVIKSDNSGYRSNNYWYKRDGMLCLCGNKIDVEVDAIVYPKQTYDVFQGTSFPHHVDQMGVTEAFVYGVATDYCVLAAVRGLRKLAIPTFVIVDAIAAVTPEGGQAAIKRMVQAGAHMVPSSFVFDAMKAIYE